MNTGFSNRTDILIKEKPTKAVEGMLLTFTMMKATDGTYSSDPTLKTSKTVYIWVLKEIARLTDAEKKLIVGPGTHGYPYHSLYPELMPSTIRLLQRN